MKLKETRISIPRVPKHKVPIAGEDKDKLEEARAHVGDTRTTHDHTRAAYHGFIRELAETYTVASIARVLGLSRQRVSDIISNGKDGDG